MTATTVTTLVSTGTPCYSARKPQVLPPDIIGDSVKKESQNGHLSGISPVQLHKIRKYGANSLDCTLDAATANYFPKEAELNDFQKHWYSSALKAMNEPSLRLRSRKDTVYRFLWLRSFHHPTCVSIEILNGGNGGAILKAIELDGADAVAVPHGKSLRRVSLRYYPKLTKELIEKIETSQFWTIPIADEQTRVYKPQAVKPGSIKLGSDGAQWIMEASKNGRYRMVRRWSPERGGFRELCVTFLMLAGLYPKQRREIY
jgi:hypothetical protein